MIPLYLSDYLVQHIAEHLPDGDPLKTMLAEALASPMRSTWNKPPELIVVYQGRIVCEIYSAEEAARTWKVFNTPRAYTVILEGAGRTTEASGSGDGEPGRGS